MDFDGVLNTPKGKFDQKAIDKLRRLLERCDAKVIISSTWRLQGVEYMRQLWKEYHLPGEVTDLTPSCNSITFVVQTVQKSGNAYMRQRDWKSQNG